MDLKSIDNCPPSSDSENESSDTLHRRHRRRQHRQSSTRPPAVQTLTLAPGSSSSTSADVKKNMKGQTPPQESINSNWDKFSKKQFSKALTVLPFAPAQASTSGERGNELLQAGYDRAAEECRRKVRKLITECKRVNMRYRDPGWDLVSRLFSFFFPSRIAGTIRLQMVRGLCWHCWILKVHLS